MKTVSITFTSNLSSKIPCEGFIEEEKYYILKIKKDNVKSIKVTEVPNNDIEGVLLD